MRPLALILLAAGAAGVVTTFVLAVSGSTGDATRAAGVASSALILGMILYRR